MSLFDQLRMNLDGMNRDELMTVSTIQHESVEGLLGGLSAVGNLMFFAANNPEYTEAKDDMKKLGYSLIVTAEILQALSYNEAEASYLAAKQGANHE